MKIAIWKIGALGDVVMTTPLIRQLRRACPGDRIDYLVGRSSAAVLQGNLHLDEVIGFDEAILYGRKVSRFSGITRLLSGYDAVFVMDKHWIFSLLAAVARVPRRIGFERTWYEGFFQTSKVPYGVVEHEILYYLSLGTAFGIPVDLSDVGLDLPAACPYDVARPYTVLVNSGGANLNEQSEIRRMPIRLFSELVGACSEQGQVVFLGTPAEHAGYEEFASASTTNLCGKTNLREAWDVLRQAQAVYATDTGLMHMAAAVNDQVTGVFGPTHPLRKCPPGARWAWVDQDRYDEKYELFGRLPRHAAYFETMTLRDIVETPHRSRLGLCNPDTAAQQARALG